MAGEEKLTVGSILALIDGDPDRYFRTLKDTEKRTERSTGSLEKIWRGAFERIGHRITDLMFRAIRGIFNEFKKSITAAIDFETALNEIGTLGVTNLQKVKKEIFEISKTFGKMPLDVAKAYYQGISAGVSEDDIFGFLGTSAKLSIAGLTDLVTAVDAVTSVVNAYGKEVMSATHASDVLFQTVKFGKTTLGELAPVIGRVTPLAASMGVSFEEVSAAIAKLTSVGFKTPEAVTGVKALLSFLNRLKSGATEAKDSFKQAGSEVLESMQKMSLAAGRDQGRWRAMLESMKELGKLATKGSNVGLTLNEIANGMERLAEAGLRGVRADQTMGKLLDLLTTKGQVLEQQLKRAGMSFKDAFAFLIAGVAGGLRPDEAMKRLEQSLTAVVGRGEDFKKALSGKQGIVDQLRALTAHGQTLNEIMGDNAEALTAALGLMKDNGEHVRQMTETMKTEQDVVEKAYQQMATTTRHQLDKLLATLETMRIEFGEKLLPMIKEGLESIIGFLNRIDALIDQITMKRFREQFKRDVDYFKSKTGDEFLGPGALAVFPGGSDQAMGAPPPIAQDALMQKNFPLGVNPHGAYNPFGESVTINVLQRDRNGRELGEEIATALRSGFAQSEAWGIR